MLRIGRAMGRTAVGIGGTAAFGGVAVAVYSNTDQGLGFRREFNFWRTVSPVVFDYWWNASSSSPYIKYQKWVAGDNGADVDKKKKLEIYPQLHHRNAPKVFGVLLDLGGLYIKLGQVLSVTALPIPEEYRELFRTLQSNVPGHEDFATIIQPLLEKEFDKPLEDISLGYQLDICYFKLFSEVASYS